MSCLRILLQKPKFYWLLSQKKTCSVLYSGMAQSRGPNEIFKNISLSASWLWFPVGFTLGQAVPTWWHRWPLTAVGLHTPSLETPSKKSVSFPTVSAEVPGSDLVGLNWVMCSSSSQSLCTHGPGLRHVPAYPEGRLGQLHPNTRIQRCLEGNQRLLMGCGCKEGLVPDIYKRRTWEMLGWRRR